MVHFPAQVVDVNVHHIRSGIKGKVPDVFDNHGASKPASGVAHKVFKQREFLGRQFNVTPGALHLAFHAVQTKIANGEDRFRRQVTASQQGPVHGPTVRGRKKA